MKAGNRNRFPYAQRGQAFLLLVITLVLGAAAIFYGLTTATAPEIERDRKSAEALAVAKSALIGYAISLSLTSASAIRLGDLPCPDTNDDGSAETACGSGAGSSQVLRLGRLPWKTLGLPDLRDGDGERLWYAVSNNFKNNTRVSCSAPGAAGCLNSDTLGTITVRDNAGNIIHNATNTDPSTSGVIAVVFSPGAILRRQDGTLQSRTCTGGAGCTGEVCNGTTTPKCNPVNYLDTSGTEDNADFTDSSGTNGFVNGIVRDGSNNIIVNDRLSVITYQDLMPLLEKRVINAILTCLKAYGAANTGRYPWANPVNKFNVDTVDANNTRFGRLPDALTNTESSADKGKGKGKGGSSLMSATWPALSCAHTYGSWWNHWREHVFYGIADAYKPADTGTPTGCGAAGDCLTVNPPNATANKEIVVVLSRKRLSGVASGQPRSSTANKQSPANYLEGENNNPDSLSDSLFTKQSSSTTINDSVEYYPP